MDADQWIRALKMEVHPEGGYYSRSFVSDQEVKIDSRERPFYTSIYFLLTSSEPSHFHRLASDELWYFHAGSPLTVHMITPEGEYRAEKLGVSPADGETPQIRAERGTVFGSTVDRQGGWSLVGCMVSPGFDFEDFELFSREELLSVYPAHADIICRLTRD